MNGMDDGRAAFGTKARGNDGNAGRQSTFTRTWEGSFGCIDQLRSLW